MNVFPASSSLGAVGTLRDGVESAPFITQHIHSHPSFCRSRYEHVGCLFLEELYTYIYIYTNTIILCSVVIIYLSGIPFFGSSLVEPLLKSFVSFGGHLSFHPSLQSPGRSNRSNVTTGDKQNISLQAVPVEESHNFDDGSHVFLRVSWFAVRF